MSNFNKIDINTRIDIGFEKVLRDIARERLIKDLDSDKKFRSPREITGMMLNCPAFPDIKKQLITMKRKEDLFK